MIRNEAAVDALCRSTLYDALAAGLAPTSAEAIESLTGAARERLVLAARVLEGGAAGAGLVAAAERLAATPPSPPEIEATCRALFGHTASGPVPAYEGEYGAADLLQKPQEIADTAGFYAAFGLVPAWRGARADHVACECEFMMFLARKESWAIEHDDAGMLEETARAGRTFLRDHLARFLPGLATRLRRADPGGFYGRLADLAQALMRYECDRLGVRAGPVALPVRPAVDDGVPMACGRCPAGAGLDDGPDAEDAEELE